MFDPVTIDLIGQAPPLRALDLGELPQRFTNAYAEIVAARVRLRGYVGKEHRTEALAELMDEMRRLAATQEALVVSDHTRDTRASAAFVAATAHQLCLMAEVVGDGSPGGDGEQEPLASPQADRGDGPGEDTSLPRVTYIDAVRVAPEVCATLLFLIADAQPDAAEMAKRIRPPEGSTGEARLAKAIADLASGRLRAVATPAAPDFDAIVTPSIAALATDALLRHLHAGVRALASEVLSPPARPDAPSRAKEIFSEVKRLAMAPIDGVFGSDGPVAVSVFPGPLHLANLLLGVERDLVGTGICQVPVPPGVGEAEWSGYVRRAARRRPYLWRNHREAIAGGYLDPGVSAAVSFPTGGGKSTLAELKIAVALLLGKRVVVLAPTLALVDQTAFALRTAFRNSEVVGDLEDESSLVGLAELPEILVSTPERCLMLQSLQADAFTETGLIMFDECHLMHARDGDRSRRAVDAMLCVLNLTHLAPEADLLMISAMMRNAGELAGWLGELTGRRALALDLAWKPTRQARGCVTYAATRITELEGLLSRARRTATTKNAPRRVRKQLTANPLAFFCLRQTWASLRRKDYALMPLLDQPVTFNTGTTKGGNWYLTPNGNQVAAGIAVAASYAKLKTLVFVQSTVAAEGAVSHVREELLGYRVKLTDAEAAMRARIEEEMGGARHCYLQLDDDGHVLGVGTSHHAQLLKDERDLHRSLFERRDGLNILFATSTVAQGMNLPSDIVIIAGDSRWDDASDRMQQLEAHELLNAAGRAGRAGESGQGFVLVVPSRVVDINEEGTKIDEHWTLLQGVFAQSDQCLQIDDPLTMLLDRIHDATVFGGNEEYLVARLPTASGDDPDGPARSMLSRSFAAYRKRVAGDAEWINSRIEAAMVSRATKVVAVETSWLATLASSIGLPVEMLASLSGELESGAFSGTTSECIDRLFDWLTGNPAYVLQLLRPGSLEGLFGKSYKELEGSVEKAIYALPVLRTLTKAWMVGEPLSKLELAAGTPPVKLGTCETARHFANKVVSDLAFVAGLPARILVTRDAVSPGVMVPTVVATLAAAVRGGYDSPEVLANAVLLGKECSRVGARKSFETLRAYLQEGSPFEAFEVTRDRVRDAHVLTAFNDDL